MIDRYEILRELAAGGMGKIYLARDRTLGREIALKVLLETSFDLDGLARFEREGTVVARVQHPNIVTIHASGVHAGKPWLAMEFVTGGSLKDRLKREGPLPPAEAEHMVIALADALAHAHAAGVLHRDLKPDNILLAQGGRPLLTDFGLARDLSETRERLTRSGDVMGSPAYMAPEQAQGSLDGIGPATDIYGLGATLYEMLTGRPPFKGKSLLDTLSKVVSDAPTPPRQIRPEISEALETVCLRCLEKEPSERYGSAAELIADLRRVASSGHSGNSAVPLLPIASALLVVVLGAIGVTLATPDAVAPNPSTRADPVPAREQFSAQTTGAPVDSTTELAKASGDLRRVARDTNSRQKEAKLKAWLARYPDHPEREGATLLLTEAQLWHPSFSVRRTAAHTAVLTSGGLLYGTAEGLKLVDLATQQQSSFGDGSAGVVSRLARIPGGAFVLGWSQSLEALLLDSESGRVVKRVETRVEDPVQIVVDPTNTRVAFVGRNVFELFGLPDLELQGRDRARGGSRFTSGSFLTELSFAYTYSTRRGHIRFRPSRPDSPFLDELPTRLKLAAVPGGSRLVYGGRGSLYVLDIEAPGPREVLQRGGYRADREEVLGLVYTRDGERVVCVAQLKDMSLALEVFDAKSREVKHSVAFKGQGFSLTA